MYLSHQCAPHGVRDPISKRRTPALHPVCCRNCSRNSNKFWSDIDKLHGPQIAIRFSNLHTLVQNVRAHGPGNVSPTRACTRTWKRQSKTCTRWFIHLVGPPLDSGTMWPAWKSRCVIVLRRHTGHSADPMAGPWSRSHNDVLSAADMCFFFVITRSTATGSRSTVLGAEQSTGLVGPQRPVSHGTDLPGPRIPLPYRSQSYLHYGSNVPENTTPCRPSSSCARSSSRLEERSSFEKKSGPPRTDYCTNPILKVRAGRVRRVAEPRHRHDAAQRPLVHTVIQVRFATND